MNGGRGGWERRRWGASPTAGDGLCAAGVSIPASCRACRSVWKSALRSSRWRMRGIAFGAGVNDDGWHGLLATHGNPKQPRLAKQAVPPDENTDYFAVAPTTALAAAIAGAAAGRATLAGA